MRRVRVCVVGAGVIGFSTAVCVAEALPFCSVTLLADKFSPDTTSDGAAGILFAAKFPGVQQSLGYSYISTHITLALHVKKYNFSVRYSFGKTKTLVQGQL